MPSLLDKKGPGYGDRSGDGCGHGRGDGFGYGYGGGFGHGYGFGFGYGYGYGYRGGYGDQIATVGDFEVFLYGPWKLVSVGCEVHAVEHWMKHWREIADEHGVEVDEDFVSEVEQLIAVKR